jgi:hypothetical protein
MVKGHDSGSSSNSNSPRASQHYQEDIYDCPPPPKARFPEADTTPPSLPPKKNPSRRDKPGLPPSRPSFKAPVVARPESEGEKRPPVPKPRMSIQKPNKPVPAPRRKKSLKVDGVTEDDTEVDCIKEAETGEDVYEEMANISVDTTVDSSLNNTSDTSYDSSSLPATYSSVDRSGVVSINWGNGGVDNALSPERNDMDIEVPAPITPRIVAQDNAEEQDEYIQADLDSDHLEERPPSGGCDGDPHPPSPPPQRKTKTPDSDENVMVDNDVYVQGDFTPDHHSQPEGRVVIGAELTAEEIENMANESAERVPERLGAYGTSGSNPKYGTSGTSGTGLVQGTDTDFDDPCYGTIWGVKTGNGIQVQSSKEGTAVLEKPGERSSSSSTDSLSALGDAPPPPSFPAPNPPVAPRAKPPKPVESLNFETPGSRDSTLSFNEPEPSFAPPPLPPTFHHSPPPPHLPPRPISKPSFIHKPPVLSPSPSPLQKSQSIDFPLFAPDSPDAATNVDYLTVGDGASNSTSALYSPVNKPTKPQRPAPTPPKVPMARQDTFESNPGTPTFAIRPGYGSFPGGEEDPFGASTESTSSSGPPAPPPKVNPFEHLFDASRGTYCLWQGDEKLEEGESRNVSYFSCRFYWGFIMGRESGVSSSILFIVLKQPKSILAQRIPICNSIPNKKLFCRCPTEDTIYPEILR